LLFLAFGCKDNFPESDVAVEDRILLFNASQELTKEPGKDYSLLAEVAPGAGVQVLEVKLRGPNFPVGKTFSYRVVSDETTAQEGVHYRLLDDGEFTVPSRQKDALIRIEIPSFRNESEGSVLLVLELLEGDEAGVDDAHAKIGIPILLKIPPLPIPDVSLHEVLTQGVDVEGRSYNTIFIDPLDANLPNDFRQAFQQVRSNMQASGNKRTPLVAYLHFYPTDNEVMFVSQYDHASNIEQAVARAVVGIRYTFEPDADGIGKLVYQNTVINGSHRTNGNFAPILQDYLEKYDFKLDWVDYDIADPPRPGMRLGGFYQIDESTAEPSGDILIGAVEYVNPDILRSNTLQLNLPSSPMLHEAFISESGLSNVTYSDYYNGFIVDPSASYQSSGFKSLWEAANAEVAADIELHKWLFYFGVRNTFWGVKVDTYYTKAGVQSRGRMQFDFRIDPAGNTRPFYFYSYSDGNGRAGAESRTEALVDNLLMSKEFTVTRNGDRVRFADKNDPAFYFEGELQKYASDSEVDNLTWLP